MRGYFRAKAIQSSRVDDALVLGTLLGYVNFSNNDGMLEDDELEQHLFGKFRSQLNPEESGADPEIDEVDVLHIITQAYEAGGHSRVLAMLVEGLLDTGIERHRVVVTRQAAGSFTAAVDQLGVESRLLSGRLIERTRALIWLGRKADFVVLYTHPDDLSAALAARALRSEGKRVLFLNHADHVFSFGPGAADVVLEISAFGWQTTQARRRAIAQHYLGIPVVRSAQATPVKPTDTAGPVVSVGSGYKYEPNRRLSFPDFLIDLLAEIPNDVQLIGPSGDEPWWAEVKQRHPARISFLGPQTFEDTEKRIGGAACYVDSFPVQGGTAFPQALMIGKAVFSPEGATSGGYGVADRLKSRGIPEMTKDIRDFLRSGIEPQQYAEIRRRILTDFNASAIADRFRSALSGEYATPPDEILASACDLDVHFSSWRERKKVTVPPKSEWTALSLRGRLSVLRDIALDRVSGYSGQQRWDLAQWLV